MGDAEAAFLQLCVAGDEQSSAVARDLAEENGWAMLSVPLLPIAARPSWRTRYRGEAMLYKSAAQSNSLHVSWSCFMNGTSLCSRSYPDKRRHGTLYPPDRRGPRHG